MEVCEATSIPDLGNYLPEPAPAAAPAPFRDWTRDPMTEEETRRAVADVNWLVPAPAAEGPREDGLLPKRKWILAAAERAAALPGAEAGTPDGEEVRRIVRDALRRPLSSTEAAYLNRLAALTSEVVTGNAALVTAEGELVELEAENARLTSEVRALREERDDWQESARIYVRSNRELRAQLRAARLASPSPTGAPAEQQKN